METKSYFTVADVFLYSQVLINYREHIFEAWGRGRVVKELFHPLKLGKWLTLPSAVNGCNELGRLL